MYPISYMHYWCTTDFEVWQESWPQVVAHANFIVKEAGISVTQTGSDDTSPTLDVDEGIYLNGVTGNDYETLGIDVEGGDMSFCKTARRPYDLVVTAILLRASMVAGKAIRVRYDQTARRCM
jgi:hypothetical protein